MAHTRHVVSLHDSELRFDVYRASGAGGQHVNTTESAVRVTHLPTGITASIQARLTTLHIIVKGTSIYENLCVTMRRRDSEIMR